MGKGLKVQYQAKRDCACLHDYHWLYSKRGANIFNLSSFTFLTALNLSWHWHTRDQGMNKKFTLGKSNRTEVQLNSKASRWSLACGRLSILHIPKTTFEWLLILHLTYSDRAVLLIHAHMYDWNEVLVACWWQQTKLMKNAASYPHSTQTVRPIGWCNKFSKNSLGCNSGHLVFFWKQVILMFNFELYENI